MTFLAKAAKPGKKATKKPRKKGSKKPHKAGSSGDAKKIESMGRAYLIGGAVLFLLSTIVGFWLLKKLFDALFDEGSTSHQQFQKLPPGVQQQVLSGAKTLIPKSFHTMMVQTSKGPMLKKVMGAVSKAAPMFETAAEVAV
jgi:hypothetical protein